MKEKTPVPGLVLAGRYKLEEKLGEGGMGTVWRAEHLVLMAPVAVKILDRDVTRDEEAHDRFIREARAAAALRSPHVVQTLDYGIDDGYPYIAMELLEGETLQRRLVRSGKLSALETARIITHVARAVGRAHEAGIIHRDLKPENVFIVKNEDAEICKVLDFGVAKVEKAELGPKGTRTRTGSLLGTPFYMSPEQAQGNKTVDPRSDLWSLGVIAFECITGKRPFESEGLGDLVLQICVRDMPVPSQLTSVPPKFDEWFAKACQRDPEQRYQTARELSEALRDAVGVEARETLATLSDDDLPSAPKSVVVRSASPGDESTGTAKTLITPPQSAPDADPEAPNAHKPSLTVRQFGTTASSVPMHSNRTALLLGVGLAALAVGVIAGFVVLGGPGALGGTEPSARPEGASASAPSASASAEPAQKRDRDASNESAEAAAPVQETTDAAPSADAAASSADAGPTLHSVEKDKEEKSKIKDAGFDRDWGLIKEDETKAEPPETKPDDKRLPPPPPPITNDQ